MKFIQFALPLSILAILLSACGKIKFWGVTGKGEIVTETRTITGFDKISLSIDADIHYVQDTVYFVQISAQSNILDVLETEVLAGEMKIDYSKQVWKHKPVKITIHTPDITSLAISGSGNIDCQNNLVSTSLKLKISGSGNIYIPSLTAQNIETTISGSGDISIAAGNVHTETMTISGSGNVEALELVSNISNAKISGSGNISVQVMQSLEGTISGSGDIRYKGTATVDADISGSGNIIHI